MSSAVFILWALAVGYSRVYLGYHTAAQVVVGLLVGVATAAAWAHGAEMVRSLSSSVVRVSASSINTQ